VNVLLFRSMDRIFDTRTVTRAGPVWELQKRQAPLDFRYRSEGQEHFAEEFASRTFTNALVVLKDGVIVHEEYRNLADATTHFVSFSLAKSVVSMLVGLAVQDGHIRSLEDPISNYIPELKGSGYDGVPIRQVLRMRSGVAYDERYDFGVNSQAQQVHESAVVRNEARFTDMARRLSREREPGSRFNYSTMDAAVLGLLVERATGRPLAKYMGERLWEPAGMESTGFWIADGPPGIGRELAGMGYNAVARDFARLGQMMLDLGRAGGRQVLPEAWVKESTASTLTDGPRMIAKTFAIGYGYQWWTLHGTGAYTGIGLQGQYIYVDPLSRTVIVKLSYFPPGDNGTVEEEVLSFFRAASAWQPR
jgi:CubicO group peptidase (beta-lactamase class C family)